MVISLVLLFTTCMLLSFFEESFLKRDKIILYVLFGIAMILIAGLREVGSTPDSEAYEQMFEGEGLITEELTEPTFTIIANILKSLSLGINALFIVYAVISIAIHLPVLWKLSKFPLIMLTIYISYYFMKHEMMQIRAGVAAGFILWAIYFYAEKKKMITLGMIIMGTLFHVSAAAGLLIFLFRNKISYWQKYVLWLIVPVGLAAYFMEVNFSALIPDWLGGDKLALYQELKEKGIEEDMAGWPLKTNLIVWTNIVLYMACIYYSDYLTKYCKYVPIAIKMQFLGLCFLFFTHCISDVLANRMNDLFSISTIILWAASVHAFYPSIASKIISNVISILRFSSSMAAYALALLFM